MAVAVRASIHGQLLQANVLSSSDKLKVGINAISLNLSMFNKLHAIINANALAHAHKMLTVQYGVRRPLPKIAIYWMIIMREKTLHKFKNH